MVLDIFTQNSVWHPVQIDVLYFGDQLPHHCLGNHPGYPSAQNRGRMRLENEDGEWKATNWRDWFGRRCFFAGAAKQKGSLPDIVACCALPDKLAFAQLDSGEAWLLVTRDGKKERKGQISDLLEQREKGNIP